MRTDFSDLYDWHEEPETFDFSEFEAVSKSWGWAESLLRDLGFTVQTWVDTKSSRSTAIHQGNTLNLWSHDSRDGVRHELAHAIVWLSHGKPGYPFQWGIGTVAYPVHLARLQETLVGAVEWVLETRFGVPLEAAYVLKDLQPSLYGGVDESALTPALVIEAVEIVDEVLGQLPESSSFLRGFTSPESSSFLRGFTSPESAV